MTRERNGRSRGRRTGRWPYRIHRGLGLFSLVFVLVLSTTGIALNHAVSLGLDQKFIQSHWILDLYQISSPRISASFKVLSHQISMAGGQLYFDDKRVGQRQPGPLHGAVALDDLMAAAVGDQMFILTPGGDLVEQLDLTPHLADVVAIGTDQGRLVIQGRSVRLSADSELMNFTPLSTQDPGNVLWATPEELSPALKEAIAISHRGAGVTVERLLADLHSGRLLGRLGPRVMDAAGIVMIFLSLTGLILWFRRRRHRRSNGRAPGVKRY